MTHKLKDEWRMFFCSMPERTSNFEGELKELGSFSTVEDFWSYFEAASSPSKLSNCSSYHIFKSSVRPVWECEQNKSGGAYHIFCTTPKERKVSDKLWESICLLLIGGSHTDNVNGVVFAKRKKADRISLWTRLLSLI